MKNFIYLGKWGNDWAIMGQMGQLSNVLLKVTNRTARADLMELLEK